MKIDKMNRNELSEARCRAYERREFCDLTGTIALTLGDIVLLINILFDFNPMAKVILLFTGGSLLLCFFSLFIAKAKYGVMIRKCTEQIDTGNICHH